MLGGEPPFTGTTTQAIIAKLMTEEPRRLSVLRKSVPPHVEAAVHRAMEKLPADRFGRAAALAAAVGGKTVGRYVGKTGATPRTVLPSYRPTVLLAAALAVLGAAIGLLLGRGVFSKPVHP